MKNIAVFGSTGSIGVQTLEVIKENPTEYQAYILTANRNIELLEQQIVEFSPKIVIVTERYCYEKIVQFCQDKSVYVSYAWDELNKILNENPIDFAVLAISGAAGIYPALQVIEAGIDFGLANKETLVAAGDYVKQRIAEKQVKMLPIDSEHSAIYQCLQNQDTPQKIVLTASGGPFRTYSSEQLKFVTPEDALKHPTWSMGKKISIDSATLMNKGLEVIEAHHLFDLPYEKIDIIVHQESVVHSMVVFEDGAYLAQLGPSDMKLPISYAMSYPKRLGVQSSLFDLADIGMLHFEKPNFEKFPALRLAYQAGKLGLSMPTVLNGANEVAVAAFLDRKIGFLDIPEIVERTMDFHNPIELDCYDTIRYIDKWARKTAREIIISSGALV